LPLKMPLTLNAARSHLGHETRPVTSMCSTASQSQGQDGQTACSQDPRAHGLSLWHEVQPTSTDAASTGIHSLDREAAGRAADDLRSPPRAPALNPRAFHPVPVAAGRPAAPPARPVRPAGQRNRGLPAAPIRSFRRKRPPDVPRGRWPTGTRPPAGVGHSHLQRRGQNPEMSRARTGTQAQLFCVCTILTWKS
jgi:hypothetical protein